MSLRRITPLVGEQGSGKSTLLKLLLKPESHDFFKYSTAPVEPHESYSFDFEKDNPRIKTYISEKSPGFQVSALFASHGEVNLALLEKCKECDPEVNTVFLMDEPDMALSPCSILKLGKQINDLSKQMPKLQLIFACHNPWLIECFTEVYSLTDKQWVFPDVYLNYMRSLAIGK